MYIVYMHVEVLIRRYGIFCDRHGVTGKSHGVTESTFVDCRYHYYNQITSIVFFTVHVTEPLLKAMEIYAVS